MGLFSSKKKVYVSSVVYNMAGDETDRPDYLKTVVIGHVMAKTKGTMGESINSAMLKGPGIKLRSFARWGRTSGYNAAIGQVSGNVFSGNSVNNSYLAGVVPKSPGDDVSIQSVNIGNADYTYWVDQYMLIFHPDLINTNYVAEFVTGVGIHITFEGGGGADFFPANWDPQARFMYVAYNTDNSTGNYLQMFIYKLGSGDSTLDAMFAAANDVGDFFPFIPIRVNNQFVNVSHPTTYAWAKKAYRKAFNDELDSIIDTVANNASLGDIDYAYVVFGVSLNTKENTALKYVYNFFLTIQNQGTYDGSYSSWQAAWDAAVAQMETWGAWKEAQENPADPLYGTAEPPNPVFPRMPNNMTQVMSTPVTGMNYNMTIRWASLVESFGSGLKKPDAKPGDLWWETGGSASYQEVIYSDELIPTDVFEIDTTYLHWQVDQNNWRTLTFTGLVHENMIYKGKSVETTAYDAILDTEESGFIVPLHEQIYNELGLKDGTQMSSSCAFLIFNCYVEKKIRWYQRRAFKILLVVVIIAVAVATGGIGAGSAGLLGTAGSVGASLGFTGLAATIVGAVANALAAMILIQIIQTGAVAIFGDKLGSIIGAIVGVVTLNFASVAISGVSMAQYVGEMASAINILTLTNAVGSGYAGYIQAAAAKTSFDAQEMLDNYAKESESISKLWDENIGDGSQLFDPLSFLQMDNSNFMPESSDEFLNRTLMVGSDVVEMSMALLDNFTEITLAANVK